MPKALNMQRMVLNELQKNHWRKNLIKTGVTLCKNVTPKNAKKKLFYRIFGC